MFTSHRIAFVFGAIALIALGTVLFSADLSAPTPDDVADDVPSPVADRNGDATSSGETPPLQQGSVPANAPAVKKPDVGTPSGVVFVTPSSEDVWAVNESHAIMWNKPATVTGGLYLVNEATKKTVGWIVPSTGGAQNSFAWDTRDVAIDRVGGTRKNIEPGSYTLHLTLDGRAEVVSSPFTIVAQGFAQTVTQVVRIKSEKITPNQLTVARGTSIAFVNGDAKAHRISGEGLQPFTVPANGGFYVLKTGALTAGTYNYYSDVYSYIAPGTLIVK